MDTIENFFHSPAYLEFLSTGGSIEAHLTASDLGINAELERFFHSQLQTGFEIPPTPSIGDDRLFANILLYGRPIDRAITYAYRHDGRATYFRQHDGTYRLRFELPISERI